MTGVDSLAAGQLAPIEYCCVIRIRSGILAPSIGPSCQVICIPVPAHASCSGRGHGRRIGEPNKAGTAHLPWVDILAALQLSAKECCGIDWIRRNRNLAATIRPHQCIISVPLTSVGVVKWVVKLTNADA